MTTKGAFMKSFLSLIIKITIAVLVFFGLKYLGVIDYIQEKIGEYNDTSTERNIEKAKDLVDLSEIDDEYTIDKTMKILKKKMVLAQHNASGQKMIIIEANNSDFITKDDIKSDNIQEKIDKFASKYKNKLVKIENVKVTKHSDFYGLNQSIPYVKIKAEISNLPIKDIEGILGIAELDNGKNIMIASFNENKKYSQIITEAFFEKVKNAK